MANTMSGHGSNTSAKRALTDAQVVVLSQLLDGEWRGLGAGTSGVASRCVDAGLAERRGESKTIKPNGSGYQYRITDAGRQALVVCAWCKGWGHQFPSKDCPCYVERSD